MNSSTSTSSPDGARPARRVAIAVVAALAGITAGCGGSGDDGAALPALQVSSLDGSAGGAGPVADLGDLVGTPLVVNLWAPWCPPCKAEMPDFDSVARARDDVRIVGLATGTEEAAAADYATEIGVSYELLYDVDDLALGELDVAGLPATLFVDDDGTIVETHHGVLTAAELDAKITELISSS